MFRVISCLCVSAALVLAVSSAAQAYTITSDVFDDEFTGATLNATKWTSGGTVTIDSGMVTLTSATVAEYAMINSLNNSLAGLGTSTDWAAEVRFEVTGPMKTSPDQTYILLNGAPNSTSSWVTRGIDFRLAQDGTGASGSTYNLCWWGWDTGNGSRVASVIATGLNKGQFYTVGAHRTSTGVDIYLGGNKIITEAVIGTDNPLRWRVGDGASGDIYAYNNGVSLDYVRVGAFVTPEPSSMALLVMAGLGLIAYAWRKRR